MVGCSAAAASNKADCRGSMPLNILSFIFAAANTVATNKMLKMRCHAVLGTPRPSEMLFLGSVIAVCYQKAEMSQLSIFGQKDGQLQGIASFAPPIHSR